MIATPPITEQDLRNLPRWSRVAFAARCGRRVQPLLRRFWQDPAEDVLEVRERAAVAAERSAAQAGPVSGLDGAVQDAQRICPGTMGLPQTGPYGAPAGQTLRPAQTVRHAVACTAAAAALAAQHAAQGDDDQCVRDTYDAYRRVVHAAREVHVTGLERVLQADFRSLQQAASAGQVTESTPVSPDVFALERELRAFRRELPRLLQESEGRFALVHEDAVDGTWDTYEDALQAGYDRYQLQPFLVKQVRPGDEAV